MISMKRFVSETLAPFLFLAVLLGAPIAMLATSPGVTP